MPRPRHPCLGSSDHAHSMLKHATDAATSCPRAVVPVCAADMCCAWPWMEGNCPAFICRREKQLWKWREKKRCICGRKEVLCVTSSGDKNGQEVVYGSGFGNGEASIRSKHQHRKVLGKSSPTLGAVENSARLYISNLNFRGSHL